MTPLEALDKMYQELSEGDTTNVEGFDYSKANKYYRIVEKSLKALEIIKIKKVDMVILNRAIHIEGSHHYYNKEIEKHLWIYEDKLLTPQEFDLLKEILL